ncbi:MAG: M14 family zinc carboxypeptidase [Clostridia bacterium]
MFGYEDLLKEVDIFNSIGVETGVVGDSYLKNRIPYIYIGNDKKNCIIVQGAIHAREHITALLVLDMAKHLLARKDLILNGGIYFIPMVNVDGVMLAQQGDTVIKDKQLRKKLLQINGHSDFSLWKANARGVDLNVNFDANFGSGEQNVFYPSSQNYVGEYANSEPETMALINFTTALRPKATLSYHTKGEVIYWRFGQTRTKLWEHYRLAKGIAQNTSYALAENSRSAGGYKDWCIQKLDIPAFTIEVGKDSYSHPYPYADYENLLMINKDIPRKLVNTLNR